MKFITNLFLTVFLTMLAIYVIKQVAKKTNIPMLNKIVNDN